MAEPNEVLQWPGFASDDPGGGVLSAVRDDETLAELVRFDEATGATIFRAFGLAGIGGTIRFEDAEGNEIAGNAHSHELAELLDVTITAPATGHFLRWSGAEWVNAAIAWNDVAEKPTTATRWPTFAEVTTKPTTLGGYGITDALPLAGGTLTGALSGTSASLSGSATVAGDVVVSGILRRATADGADTGILTLSGGGARGDTRGAYIDLVGNDIASGKGILNLAAGDAGTAGFEGGIHFYTGASQRRMLITRSGAILIGTSVETGALAGDMVFVAGRGTIFTTPDGTKRYRISVSNAGAVTSTLL